MAFGRDDVCEHGSLRRKCNICTRDEDIAALQAELARARELLQQALDAWTGDGPAIVLDTLRAYLARAGGKL